MQLKNSQNDYGFIAILMHWLMALLIIFLLVLGLYMVALPISLQKLKYYGWHKEYGLLVLALVCVRLLWRLTNATPQLSLPTLEKFAARVAHWSFYGLMFALPLSGWLMTSASGLPVSFFGWFTLPDLIAANETHRLFLMWLHKWLAYGFLALLVLHVAAALKHHFINKDDILKRMLP